MHIVNRYMTKATEIYRERLEKYRALSRLQIRHYRLVGILFLVCLVAGIMVLSYIPRTGTAPLVTIVAVYLYILILLYLYSIQKRIEKLRLKCNRGIQYYERGLARLENRWAGSGITGEKYCDEAHLYAKDIDIFGKGGLFELLCNTRTRSGEELLANWLLVPGTPNIIRARQDAVAELRDKLDFREDIAILSEDIATVGSKEVRGLRAPLISFTPTNSFNTRTAVEVVHGEAGPSSLERWGTAPPELNSRLLRVTAFVLSLLPLTGVVLWIYGFGPKWLSFLFVNAIFALSLRRRVVRVILAANQIGRELTLFSQILERIEREEFVSSRLARLKEALEVEGAPPSRRIARLHSIIVGLDARRSLIFMPFAGIFLWATQFAFSIEAWRLKSGALIERWIAAVAEIEALSSIACYAYEHDNDPFPEIVENGLCFEAKSIGHPLIPEERCIKNDIMLNNDIRLLVVSGSNTSGKSTLLRTVGTNAVLAFAGAPVRAQRLRISPMSLGASIRIQDSLQNGTSLFYAEIKRIRQLMMGMNDGLLPLLFIIEEILHGTNSHDRLIGAEAILTKLVEKGAVGLVTTHDLSLTNLTKKLGTRAMNVYFECQLNNGQMEFDYILRQGIAGNSNAIELMRAVGIEV
jgi:MutS-like protein